MDINPTGNYNDDCFADADAGFWNSKDDQDPRCVRSWTEFVIMFIFFLCGGNLNLKHRMNQI